MLDAMKALVVYESMYGNTHAVADAMAEGLGDGVECVPPTRGRACPPTSTSSSSAARPTCTASGPR